MSPGIRPLEGVQVLEPAHYVAGPCAAMILGDQGASVCKVEPLGGEPGWRAMPWAEDCESLYYACYNRNTTQLSMGPGEEREPRPAPGTDRRVRRRRHQLLHRHAREARVRSGAGPRRRPALPHGAHLRLRLEGTANFTGRCTVPVVMTGKTLSGSGCTV